MEVINYFDSNNKDYWLSKIKQSDWSGTDFLIYLFNENLFFSTLGNSTKLLLLIDNDDLVSFCTYAEKDDIQPTDLTPWLGFVFTFPKYRGNGYLKYLFDKVEVLARKDNVSNIYISTNHTGLYEKYGFEFYQMMNDIHGEPSRVYVKRISDD